ncbi:hypothetical protein J6590_100049 [Homalodisca vitripennis]|nr:hypothetical protein J6590_100049 [Homalodisca vitripennis]
MLCAKCKSGFSKPEEIAQCVECRSAFLAACCRLRTTKKLQRMRNNDSSRWRCDECSEDSSSLQGRSDSEDSNILRVLKNIQDDMAQSRKENSKSFATLEATMTSVKESLDDMRNKLSLVKEGRLAYAWIKDSKILVRKTPSSKAVQVWFDRNVTKAAFPPRLPDESQAEDSQLTATNNNSSISPPKGQVNY